MQPVSVEISDVRNFDPLLNLKRDPVLAPILDIKVDPYSEFELMIITKQF
jgi:hypothetical protein